MKTNQKWSLALFACLFLFAGQVNAALTLIINSYSNDHVTFTIDGTLDATTIGGEPGYIGVKNDWSNNVAVHTEWFSTNPAVTANLSIGGVPVVSLGIQNDVSEWQDNFWFENPSGGSTTAIPAGTAISGTVTLTAAGAFNPADAATLELVSGFSANQWVRLESTSRRLIVDYSPDTTGVPAFSYHINHIGGVVAGLGPQYTGDRFTLSQDSVVTGGAIFSLIQNGVVGDPVRFVILPDDGGMPGAVPVVDVMTVLDVIDSALTSSIPDMERKHASIPPQVLPAGDYWFYMTGDGVEITQGAGIYDDNSIYFGVDEPNPDLEMGEAAGYGDNFFTIEGDSAHYTLLGVNSGAGEEFLAEIDVDTAALTILGATGKIIDGLAMGDGVLYAANNQDRTLVTLNPTTGAITSVIGPYTNSTRIEALAFRESDGALFGIDDVVYVLTQMDTNTGTATPIGTPGNFPNLAGMAFAQDGTLYGISCQDGSLYTIDTTTGAATLVAAGPPGDNCPLGLAFHPVTDVAYTATYIYSPSDSVLEIVNTTDATRTAVGVMTGGPQIEGLTFTAVAAPAALADLTISKLDTPDPVIAGTNLTYTIRVDNVGNAVAENVVVNDTLPAGLTLVSTTSCAEDPGGVPTCSLGSIAGGAYAEYTVIASVDPSVLGTVINTVTVTTTSTESDDTNNSATAETTVNAEADLSITKMDSSDPFISGTLQMLTYTIEVSNAGPSDATNVVVNDILPAFVMSHYTTGCLNDPNGVPDCQLGTIPAGGSAIYTISVQVPRAGGLMTNVVSVSSDASDPVGDNDSVVETTEVIPIPIPTLNTLGLLTLILLLGSMGWVAIRRF